MICPDCKGTKMLSANLGGPPDMPDMAWFNCTLCGGSGEVTPQRYQWRTSGAIHRAARIGRKESLREYAQRLGIALAELADMENGRADPDRIHELERERAGVT